MLPIQSLPNLKFRNYTTYSQQLRIPELRINVVSAHKTNTYSRLLPMWVFLGTWLQIAMWEKVKAQS